MNRFPMVLCLSFSVLAVALAWFALLKNEPGGIGPDVKNERESQDLRRRLMSLSERVRELESRQAAFSNGVPSPRKRSARSRAAASSEPADLEGQVAALTERLAALEDGETIARLARSGEEQVVRRELNAVLARIGDPGVSPEDQLAALDRFRRLGKSNWQMVSSVLKENEFNERDVVMPMLELARDTSLDPGFRAEVLHRLDSKVPELRQPLLDMLAFEESPEVRQGSMEALMYHLGDASVRDAIRQASQEDRHESVQATARKYLPKVQHFDRQAAEEERARSGRTDAGGTSPKRPPAAEGP